MQTMQSETGQTFLEKAIEIAGGKSQLARKINNFLREEGREEEARLQASNIQYWLRTDRRVPPKYVLAVESFTGIPCYEIDPATYPPERFKFPLETAQDLQNVLRSLQKEI